jgi:CRP/FNR family cyclic AMP-dependent transcriptional regulator
MSVVLPRFETQSVGFYPSIDSDANPPGAVLESAGARKYARFFSDLSEQSIRAINQITRIDERPEAAIVFCEGDRARGVYLLCEGRANVETASSGGKSLILSVALPGDVLGLNAIFAGTSHAVTVTTLRPCRFGFIARENFLKLITEHHDACLYFARRLGRDCHAAYDLIRSMCYPVSARLARFLISCCANAQVKEGPFRAELVLTHETIAQRIGCSRETVCRALRDLKTKGVAELVGTTLVVYDQTILESLSTI